MSSTRADLYRRYVERAAVHQFLGLKVENIGEGEALVSVPVDKHTLNTAGTLHGGVIYLVSDVAALAALGPSLSGEEFALTIDIQCSVYRATTCGPVFFRGRVASRSRRLAFMNVDVTDGNGNLVAEARVTKAITHTVPDILRE